MKHAELLHDPASTERGNELIELYIEGFKNFRAMQAEQKNQKQYFYNRVEELAQQAILNDSHSNEDYASIGRAVIDTKLEQIEMDKEHEAREKDGIDMHDIAFASAMDFLGRHAGSPIAATLLGKEFEGSIYAFGGRHPKKVGGFIIPQIIGNAQLYISGRHGSPRPKYQLQIFDSFKPPLKIAIGE